MLKVLNYNENMSELWDDFVMSHSINGTFLQTRRFLNYHPKDRFQDSSLMIFDGEQLVSVIPGCLEEESGERIFYSHKGSSYGGLIIDRKHYRCERLLDIIQAADCYFEDNFDKAVLKITPDMFSKENSDLLVYCLWSKGYEHYNELSTYIDLKSVPDDVKASFDRNKNRNIRKCEELGLTFAELNTPEEIAKFHNLLSINLSKHNVKPIHSIPELIDLKYNRFNDVIKFFGVYLGDNIVAAGMLFDFANSVLHAQNLSYDYRIDDYSPITYLYYKVIEYGKQQNYDFVSWGISTEDKGQKLNYGLIRNKESFNSKYQINRTFFKRFNHNEIIV